MININSCFSGTEISTLQSNRESSLTWNKLIRPAFGKEQGEKGILKWVFALYRFSTFRRGIGRLRVTRPII